jgi:poly-gamma-glutamate synthesis protein (capsule biosynthesis protein)
VDLGEGSPVWCAARLQAEDEPVIVAANGGATPELAVLSVEGAWLWRLALPSPAGAVAVTDLDLDGSGEILVGLADGRILAYDGQGRLRATVQAGLPVWDLLPGSSGLVSSGLVLADLNAWRLVATVGAPLKFRLNVPGLVPLVAKAVPPDVIPMASGEGPRSGAVLAFLGDVVPGRSMELQIERYGAGYPWAGIGHLLRDADLAVGNLECVLSTRGTALEKQYVIRAHPGAVQTLIEAGFDLVSLANNHALDFGNEALDDTLSALRQANIAVVGAGRTPVDARRAALFDLNGVRVAVLAYAGGYWQGSADMPESDLIAWSDPESVAQDVGAARDQADVVVVVLHAGKEYSRTPSTTQVTLAHAAIDAGADLVVGHHPHVTQTVERYRGALVVYSLGNTLFDIPLQSAMRGELLRVFVTHEGLVQAELWPFWIDGEVQPRLLNDGQGLPRVEAIYP